MLAITVIFEAEISLIDYIDLYKLHANYVHGILWTIIRTRFTFLHLVYIAPRWGIVGPNVDRYYIATCFQTQT